MTEESRATVDRRTVLGAVAGMAAFAGCGAFEPGEDRATTPIDDDRARDLAERFAPTLYFDAAERWFPTDPRPYERERDGETVVNGFAAFDGYTERFDEGPPAPTVFYNAVTYESSPLAVVQYWLYAAFDQFTTNFHWHDWEVLHVFVDTDAGEPQLYVASSHSRKVPNNEFLDPDRPPRVLSELGSHSSALSVNDAADRFQRFAGGNLFADITNSAIEGIEDVAEFPLAYGLPRDEGGRLPYVVPELDGEPVYEHERLPSVERSNLLPREQTVRSFDALVTPPTDLPARSTGLVFRPSDGDGGGAGSENDSGTARDGGSESSGGTESDGDGGGGAGSETVTYDLVPTAEVEHIVEFAGPQLSFEFAVPKAAEDAVASHLTAPSAPWTQPRYENPAADISDPAHRRALADRYDAVGDPAPVNTVVARVTETVTSPDAPEGDGVTTRRSPVEAVALFESEPVAVPTFRGVVAVQGVTAGEHRLTVNGAGVAPHSETVAVGDGDASDATAEATDAASGTATGGAGAGRTATAAGAGGEIPLVARERATKLAVDPGGSDADLTNLAVADDFAGRLYDAPLSGPDAVYLHRGGAYTAEVRDAEGTPGAFRVNPGDEARVEIDRPRTGKAPLAAYVADVAEETRADVEALLDGGGDGSGGSPGGSRTGTGEATDPVRGLARALGAIASAAERAAELARAGDRGRADARLDAVQTRLGKARERLAAARGDLPAALARAADNRFEQVGRRAEQARATDKL